MDLPTPVLLKKLGSNMLAAKHGPTAFNDGQAEGKYPLYT